MTIEQVEKGKKIVDKINDVKRSIDNLRTCYNMSCTSKTRVEVDFNVSEGYGQHRMFCSSDNDWFRDQVYKLLLDEANNELMLLENELKKL